MQTTKLTFATAGAVALLGSLASCRDTSAPVGPDASPGGRAAATVATTTVTPSSATIAVSDTVRLTVTAESGGGQTINGRQATWESSDTTVATVSTSGLATGVGAGTAGITATIDGVSDTATLTVAEDSAGGAAVLVGAGDIASCTSSGDEATAALLANIEGTVFTAGDNAYVSGTTSEFTNCYDPSWGAEKERTRPSPGNHEYRTSGAAPYYAYFGSAAGDPGKGYYSYDLAGWHVVSLNSEVAMSSSSAQGTWLASDLAAHPAQCTLAYWHRPRFSSGPHGNAGDVAPLWQALDAAGADVVVSGHDHVYERFAPQSPTGSADASRGIREFIVGTGGRSLSSFPDVKANSEFRYSARFGVLKLELDSTGYRWSFITTDGVVRDSGSGTCH